MGAAAPAAALTAVLEGRDVSVVRGERVVARADHLAIERGETLAVLGPNGSGKTSLLLALATLLPLRGRLLHNGHEIGDPVAFRRRCAVVFQRPLLLDRSVLDNAGLGLELRGVDASERRRRAQEALERFGVGALAKRQAVGLSGGEAQRVSLARAFAVAPEILFLDEPFSALDPPTREALVADLARVLGDEGVTTFLVTHDREEARALADRVAVVIDGRVRQVGPTETVFNEPADADVGRFLTPRLQKVRRS